MTWLLEVIPLVKVLQDNRKIAYTGVKISSPHILYLLEEVLPIHKIVSPFFQELKVNINPKGEVLIIKPFKFLFTNHPHEFKYRFLGLIDDRIVSYLMEVCDGEGEDSHR